MEPKHLDQACVPFLYGRYKSCGLEGIKWHFGNLLSSMSSLAIHKMSYMENLTNLQNEMDFFIYLISFENLANGFIKP